ncbi:MAG: pyridoxal phosphate-dependent aminotransferase [Alphaproteobacteria bacterium]|nr:pyridoxal phosphate-dependent aminotransferase [Alphaproteobacteria bacterium]
MTFDFETRIDRRGTGAIKWDRTIATHGQAAPGEAFAGDGPPPIALTIADMELASPPAVLEAMTRRIAHGIFGYTLPTPEYRAAAAEWQRTRHGWDMPADAILTFHGVVPALYLLVRGLVPPGGKVLLQAPVFPPFFDVVRRNGCEAVIDELVLEDGRYRMDFARLERLFADPALGLFVLCNPHNPTGRAWTRDELARVAELAQRHGVQVVADEIHGDLVMPGCRFTPFGSLDLPAARKAITCNGLSKTMNLAGLALCNIVVPDAPLRERIAALIMGAGAFGVNPISEAGFVAGWRSGGPWLDALMRHVDGNRRFVADFLDERLPAVRLVPPEATYLLWLDFRNLGLAPDEIGERVTTRARVRIENGAAFGAGGAGFFRVNVACPRAMLAEAMERIAGALGSNR